MLYLHTQRKNKDKKMAKKKKEIKKNNALTDGHINSSLAFTRKLINVVYMLYKEKNSLLIETSKRELIRLLDLKVDKDNREKLIRSLEELMQIIRVKTEKSHISTTFIQTIIYYNKTNNITIHINKDCINLIDVIKHYTIIDLKIINQFSSNYAIAIYEIYKRYKTINCKNAKQSKKYNLEEMNLKFGTKFKQAKYLNEGIKRGIAEIRKKTNIDINFLYLRAEKKFGFFWYLSEETTGTKKSTTT